MQRQERPNINDATLYPAKLIAAVQQAGHGRFLLWRTLNGAGGLDMGVTGIGGLFFRSKDAEALRAWYVEHLGVGSLPYGEWQTQAGPSVFSPFATDTDHFPADRQYMLNLRVDDLDGLLKTLRGAGIEVTTNPEWDMPGVGRFARLADPEGNPLELWQPDESE